MLVLTRRVGERVRIGDGIVVTIVSTRGGRIRVGIDAPLDMRISRAEAIRAAVIRDNAETEQSTALATNGLHPAALAPAAFVPAAPVVTEETINVPMLAQQR